MDPAGWPRSTRARPTARAGRTCPAVPPPATTANVEVATSETGRGDESVPTGSRVTARRLWAWLAWCRRAERGVRAGYGAGPLRRAPTRLWPRAGAVVGPASWAGCVDRP